MIRRRRSPTDARVRPFRGGGRPDLALVSGLFLAALSLTLCFAAFGWFSSVTSSDMAVLGGTSVALAAGALAATLRGLRHAPGPGVTVRGALVAITTGAIVVFELCTAAVYIALRATG